MLVSFVFDEMLQRATLDARYMKQKLEASSHCTNLSRWEITVHTILVLCKELSVARCPENMVIV